MGRRVIYSLWDRDNLLSVNNNFTELYTLVTTLKNLSLTLVNDGKLTASQFADLQITLNDLVKKGSLTVNDINYNLGKIGLSHLSDEVIQAIAGNANVNAIPTDYSIPIEKLMFTNRSVNLFNKLTITNGYYINNVNDSNGGQPLANTSYSVSDFIKIDGGQTYTKNNAFAYYAFYDSAKKYIHTNTYSTQTITAPTNASFVRFTFVKGAENTVMFVKGNTLPSTYQPYYVSIPSKYLDVSFDDLNGTLSGQNLKNNSVNEDKLTIIKKSENLFDKNKITKSYYVNPTNGALSANDNWNASDYVPVKSNTKYYKTNNRNLYAFYDSNKTFINTTTVSDNIFTTPDNAKYVRVSLQPSEMSTFMIVEGNSQPNNYIEYKSVLDPALIDNSKDDLSVYGKFNLKTYVADVAKAQNPKINNRLEIAFIGDSWVEGGEFRKGERLTLPLKDKISNIYGDGGIGFVSFANNHVGNGLVNVSLNGNWTQYDDSKYNIEQSKGLDSAMVESSTAGDSIKVTFNEELDFYEIHTLNTGQWRYNVDDGDWVTIDASKQEVTPIDLKLGKHTINIEIVSDKVTFIGSYAYKGDKGVVVHKIGNGGLKAKHIESTDRDNYIKQLKRCRANTFGVLLGTNDMAQNISPEEHKKSMQEVIERIKTAKPYASIFLITPSGNNLSNTQYSMKEYAKVQIELAKDNNLGYISLLECLGDFNITNANELMFKDGIHPNASGGFAISNLVYDRLLRI
ncbi:SGNH/GDSL hydrolase family protein [Staphylococcus sp. GDX8P54P]|uniref:SGNH/GDSL hydrolase family protein n=1 Tax=Staphylococcus sp. GDX8P54P TaxID=2804099 RepID=UPI001AEC6F0D|nr:SGNH/GDSL hydrolase family protein [Staphylococcus sp. GDX8P54P]